MDQQVHSTRPWAHRKVICLSILAFAALVLTHLPALAGSAAGARSGETIVFGIVPQQSATKLARLWTPVFEKLSADTGYRIEFRTAPDIPEFERRLAEGEYDMAYMNPYHYTTFHEHPGYEAFAKEKDKLLKGILVVRADSPYRELEDLAGKTLAFPSPAAFAASVVTRAYLKNRSIPFEAKYVSSHDSVYRSVAKGIYAAGGCVPRTLNGVGDETRDQLRILWTSPGYTAHAFAAHPRVDQAIVDDVLDGLMQLGGTDEGSQLLAELNLKAITSADNAEWDAIRSMNLQSLDEPLTPDSRH